MASLNEKQADEHLASKTKITDIANLLTNVFSMTFKKIIWTLWLQGIRLLQIGLNYIPGTGKGTV